MREETPHTLKPLLTFLSAVTDPATQSTGATAQKLPRVRREERHQWSAHVFIEHCVGTVKTQPSGVNLALSVLHPVVVGCSGAKAASSGGCECYQYYLRHAL